MDENWGSPCFRIHLEAVPTAYESYVGFTSFISFVATKSDILLNMSYSIYIYIHLSLIIKVNLPYSFGAGVLTNEQVGDIPGGE